MSDNNSVNNIIKNNDNKRIIYFDVLNILAILAVIALHCNGIVHSNPNNKAWTTSLIIESFFIGLCLFF